MSDAFTLYEIGLNRLLEQLGKKHPRNAEVLTLQSRLSENISVTRQYGDTETRRAERAQILDALNQLAQEETEVNFSELCMSQGPHASIERPAKPDGRLARTPTPWWRSRKVCVPIIVALIGLASAVIPIVITRCDGDADFEYPVRVQAKDTGDYVVRARVVIEVVGEAPVDDTTDTRGLARIRIPSSRAGQPGRLVVEASGYKRYEQHINLAPNALPHVVQLERPP